MNQSTRDNNMLDTEARALFEMQLDTGSDDWSPTPHGKCLGDVLAENNVVRGKRLLELGGGVGNHTILMLRLGAEHVTTTEITQQRIDSTERNVALNCPDHANIEYRVADWLATDGEFDMVITNPPFCMSGKRNRRYFIDALILDAHKRLKPEGELVFVQSSMADVQRTQAELERNGFESRILGQHTGPFRDYYFEDKVFMQEIQKVENGFEVRDGKHYETLSVIHAKLKPWTPNPDAH